MFIVLWSEFDKNILLIDYINDKQQIIKCPIYFDKIVFSTINQTAIMYQDDN